MKTQEFQALIEQLGDLSEVQRSALVAALKGNGSPDDVIALIETRFAVALSGSTPSTLGTVKP